MEEDYFLKYFNPINIIEIKQPTIYKTTDVRLKLKPLKFSSYSAISFSLMLNEKNRYRIVKSTSAYKNLENLECGPIERRPERTAVNIALIAHNKNKVEIMVSIISATMEEKKL